MRKISETALQLFEFTLRSSSNAFAGALRTCSKFHTVLVEPSAKEGVTFRYKVTPRVCRESKLTNQGTFSVGAAIAIFDEFSTYCFMLSDKTSRPGVSIFLSAEMVEDISVDLSDLQDGLTVLVQSEPIKMGKTIGFCNMSITTLDGELLARGQHIKFLHMGFLWDLFMHPFIAPLTVQLITLISSVFKPKYKSANDLKVDDSVAGLYKEFGVKTSPVSGERSHLDSSFFVPIASSMHNPLGALHGGALAMVCEEVAIQSMPVAFHSSVIRRMEVTYISSMKDSIKIDHNYSGGKRSDGNVRNKKNVLCAQFSCFWDDLSVLSTTKKYQAENQEK